MTDTGSGTPNRLATETSPYLLQHASNPVDWYPWGDEALTRAVAEDRPVLLSIGYSACHWCHVMERESFENAGIAALMNRHFVNIKVDREERPDLDDIYMAATVALNHGQGGWPMTVFLTPELEPFFAGTYFPPDDAYGRPGFGTVLQHIARAWQEDRSSVVRQAGALTERLRERTATEAPLAVGADELLSATRQFRAEYDTMFGGFGGAPKFPRPVDLMLLLRTYRRFADDDVLDAVRGTLTAMARGGIYDHLGGGFARYATDRHWLVPHFEKMLYDNALLARVYLEAYQVTRDDHYREVAVETLDYVLRDMTAPEGGFWSSTDADSEGEEGKFFVWTPHETKAVLGDADGDLFNAAYDVTVSGNWEGNSILNVKHTLADIAKRFDLSEAETRDRLQAARTRLREHRDTRVKPGLDDKVLTAWNGLMIGALAEGYRVLRDVRYLHAATKAADFVNTELRGEDGGLLRTWRGGDARLAAYLEDYAYLAEALLDLSEAGGGERYLRAALELGEAMLERFHDPVHGSFFHTAEDHEHLILRYKDGADGPIPAPNAVVAAVLARLAHHLDRPDLREAAIGAIRANGQMIARFPRAFARSLMVVDWLLEGPTEIALIGSRDGADTEAMARELAAHFLPNRIETSWDPAAGAAPSDFPLVAGKTAIGGAATLYVCRDYACAAPVTSPEDIQALLPLGPDAGTGHEAIGVRRPGRASGTGTARFASRFESSAFAPLADTGLTASRLGFGAYRIGDDVAEHREALSRALASGVNLVDTASTYMDGASERLIGAVLAGLDADGEVARDEIVLVSKVGYVTGRIYESALRREEDAHPIPDVVKVDDGLWHCIHPDFLEEQIQRSLDRLEQTTIDVCLLHNPEYYLVKAERDGEPLLEARAEFDRRVRAAFKLLERMVQDGTIGWYGVSSNTLAASPDDPTSTSVAMFLEAAEAAGGPDHHMRVLQLPLNLAEPEAFLGEAGATALDAAARAGMAVFTNRPLNGIHEGAMVRFADVSLDPDPPAVAAAAERAVRLERDFTATIAPEIRVPDEALDPAQYFTWAQQLHEMTDRLNLEQWNGVEEHLRHGAGRIVDTLDRNLRGETRDRWLEWRAEYIPALNDLVAAHRHAAAEVAQRQGSVVTAALAPHLPEGMAGESLSRKALWVVLNTPGVACVLNGMRRADYVLDAMGALDWPAPSGEVSAAYQAVGSALRSARAHAAGKSA